MENIQINGQKIWGPPKDWVGPPPPHGTEVFIKNLPDDVFEDELYYLFSAVGKIYEVRLPVHWTGVNKGFAFVRFTKISDADAAIDKLNRWMIRQGRQIRVERSLDNTRLFLSSVPKDKTGEEIKSDLLSVVENVKTVYVYPALENPSLFRGYAFVEFVCHRDAAIGKRILTPDVLFNLFERKCIAAWANPLPFLNKETLKNINILFMRNIPSNTKSISIRMAVDSLIAPDNVHKVKRLNNYAFLTFKNHDMAERAMMKIKGNPFLLGMKAIHVEWAIPREIANSLTSKGLDPRKDDGTVINIERNIESCRSLFKILDSRTEQPNFITEDYFKMNCLEADNIENYIYDFFPNNSNIKILQKPSTQFESLPLYNKIQTPANKTKAKPNFGSSFYQNIVNNSSDLTALMTEISNQNKNTEDQSLITEFLHYDREDNFRDRHLKNWLQSLAPSDQYTSCATSPTLTSLSTSSCSNTS